MARLLLCANPAASGFTGGLHRDVLDRLRASYDVESEWPKTPSDTRRLSAAAARDGYTAVIAMGGDGVVHHVAHGVSGSDAALGIIPVGTTNVFGRLIGVPTDPHAAAAVICDAPARKPVTSAALSLTHHGSTEHRTATFAVGAGFDAEVVQVAEKEPFRKYRFGGVHYARNAAGVAWKRFGDTEATLRVTADEREADAAAVMVQLHARYSYFGRLPLRIGGHAPGTATVMVARSLTRRDIAPILLRIASGRTLDSVGDIEVWEGVAQLEITRRQDPVPFQADGELLGTPTRVGIEVSGDRLHVLVPG